MSYDPTPKYAENLEKLLTEFGIDQTRRHIIITQAMIIHHDGWMEGFGQYHKKQMEILDKQLCTGNSK